MLAISFKQNHPFIISVTTYTTKVIQLTYSLIYCFVFSTPTSYISFNLLTFSDLNHINRLNISFFNILLIYLTFYIILYTSLLSTMISCFNSYHRKRLPSPAAFPLTIIFFYNLTLVFVKSHFANSYQFPGFLIV